MFDPGRHCVLRDVQWEPEVVRKTIQDIAHDAIDQLRENRTLPRHTLDEYGVCSDLYMGMAGVIWGLQYLEREQVVETHLDFAALLKQLLFANEKEFKNAPYPDNASYLFGK